MYRHRLAVPHSPFTIIASTLRRGSGDRPIPPMPRNVLLTPSPEPRQARRFRETPRQAPDSALLGHQSTTQGVAGAFVEGTTITDPGTGASGRVRKTC